MRFAISAALTVFLLMAVVPEAGAGAIVCVHGVRGATCSGAVRAGAVVRGATRGAAAGVAGF